jgi:hypothetical protein
MPQQQQMPQQMPQQMQQVPPQMRPQQMPSPEEMYQMQQQQQMMQAQAMQQQPVPRIIKPKSSFGASVDSKTLKYSVLVVLIFIILNSKIVWRQIQRLPFMGNMDPSIIALIVNSILAGVVFYLICFVFKLI